METFYKAYNKMVENRKYYFVKKYVRFPEYRAVDDIMIGYGMHVNFYRACNIAEVHNEKIQQQLFEEMERATHGAKLINLYQPAKQHKSFIQTLLSPAVVNFKFFMRYLKAVS